MKLIVETTGPFMIHGFGPDTTAHEDRPSVVFPSYLISSRAALSQVRIIGQVSDEATDAAFVDTLKQAKGDTELAIAAFMSEFPLEKPEPAPPATAAKKAK